MIAEVSRRFPEEGRKNIGEMHVIAIAKRYGGVGIIEDQQGRLAARAVGVRAPTWFRWLQQPRQVAS